DCVSTLRLADWLRHAVLTSEVVASGAGWGETRAVYHPHPRRSDAPARPATTARVSPDPAASVASPSGRSATDGRGEASAEEVAVRERASAVVVEEEIREVVGEDRARRGADERALALYGAAAGYFRREAKPFWHEHYSRLSLPTDEWLGRRNAFLVEDAVVVSGWEVEPGRRTLSRRLEPVRR